jgi:putative oxidoreductase
MLSQFPVWLPAAGRVMFASYFLLMGASHLIHFREHSGFLGRKGVPWARAATLLTILMMIGGGLLTMFDWHRSVGAVLLFGIIFPAPFFLHHFWNESESYSRLSEFAHFIKDLSLAGAALVLLSR